MEDYAASEDEFMGELRLLGAELLQTGGLEQLRCPHANTLRLYSVFVNRWRFNYLL